MSVQVLPRREKSKNKYADAYHIAVKWIMTRVLVHCEVCLALAKFTSSAHWLFRTLISLPYTYLPKSNCKYRIWLFSLDPSV